MTYWMVTNYGENKPVEWEGVTVLLFRVSGRPL